MSENSSELMFKFLRELGISEFRGWSSEIEFEYKNGDRDIIDVNGDEIIYHIYKNNPDKKEQRRISNVEDKKLWQIAKRLDTTFNKELY